jgi:hypothetical protein
LGDKFAGGTESNSKCHKVDQRQELVPEKFDKVYERHDDLDKPFYNGFKWLV